jgi:hypothetical protein
MGILWETTFGVFLLVTVALAGGAAWMSGRAMALNWRPWWHAALWMLLLGGAARFIHFSLFNGTLLSIQYYLVDTIVLIIIAAIAHRVTNVRLMSRQYSWLFERASPFGWRRRANG